MADKKYIIEVEVDVKNKKDIEKTSKDLDVIGKNANNAALQIDNLNKQIDNNTKAISKNREQQRQLTEGQQKAAHAAGGFASNIAEGAARFYAIRQASALFLNMLPMIGTALAIVTGAVVLYKGALKSANDYILSNVEAQKKMTENTTAAIAWASFWEDVSISFGKFFFSFKDFWGFFKNIAGEELLRKFGLEDYVFQAEKTIEVQSRLNTEWEKSLTQIQKLTYESEDYLKTANNLELSQKERIAAATKWAAAQLKILKIQRQKLEDEKYLNEQEKKRDAETENALEIINRKLQENDRLQMNVAQSSAEMTKAILTGNKALEERKKVLGDITKIPGVRNLEAEEFTPEHKMSPEEAELLAQGKAMIEYRDMLEYTILEMGGMWTDYYAQIQKLGEGFTKWSEQDADYRKKLTLASLETGLAMASMITQQLAASAGQSFEEQKKYRSAGATIDTLQGMVSAFAGAMQLGPIAGPIIGGLLAAAVGVLGFTNVAKIKQSQPGGGSVSSATIPTPTQAGAPAFSLINPLSTGEQQLGAAIDNQATKPVKSYVISGEVTTAQAVDRKTVANATI